ncbi:hypothetical protein DFH11DRAFT_1731492 [Phellopilus nigrolimitatus]|nr:hypothetical protein DFH11DRAFT_1731492 [Phellopilus nigrolimitatus]
MDTDVHLDTSWCPRYTVPIDPPPQQTTLVTSKLTGRTHGGGLLHGTGRVLPGGGLRPTACNKQHVAQKTVIQKQPTATVRTLMVIDQSRTPLYCNDACHRKDLDSDRLKSAESARLATKTKSHGKEKHVSISARSAQLNPARASPPPPSPVLPPVPPNSWRVPKLTGSSSSATGTSCTTSASAEERSPGEEQSDGLSNLYTDSAPPPLPPLPLHPHRAFALASAPPISNTSADKRSLFEGGILMAARRLQAVIRSGAADCEPA